jgi:hypothetical protein
VQWKHFGPDEVTWEMEDAVKQTYPILFTCVHACHVDRENIEDDVSFKGEGIVTPCFPQFVKKTILAKNYGKLKNVTV